MTSPPRPLSFGLVLAQLGSTECDASKSIGAGETAINITKEMTYVFATTVGWSRGFLLSCAAIDAMPGFRLLCSPSSSSFPRGFDAKAAFVTIDTLHDLHAFAKQRQMLGRRSRVPVSCAGCFVFTCLLALCSLACTSLAYLGEMESSLDLTSSFRTQASNLALSGNLGIQPHVRAACVWSAPRDSRACLGLRGLRRRLAVPSRIFCRPRTRMWLRHTQVILFIGLLYTYGHVC